MLLVLLASRAQAAVEGDVEGVQGGLPPVGPPLAAPPGRVQAHDRHVEALQAGLLVDRKWPRAFTARHSRALIDSIAFVLQMTVLISRSNRRNGTNSAHAFSQSRMIAG